MKFDSFADFLAMGHHGSFVWSAYAICFWVLVMNVVAPLRERRRYLRHEALRLRWESKK